MCYSLEVVANYKSALVSLGKAPSQISQELQRLYYYLGLMCRDAGFSTYCKGTKLGKLIYNSQVFSESAVQYVYDLHVKEWKLTTKYKELKEQSLSIETLRGLIRDQASRFPTSSTFDYRTLTNAEGAFDDNKIDQYFNQDLVKVVDEITTSRHAREHPHSQSTHYQEACQMRVRMVIALMCFAMNPFCTFFQTLLGLVCYSFGLRDGGFSILNRNPVDELNRSAFWRITIDNLDFTLKYAKSLIGGGVKKMLYLTL